MFANSIRLLVLAAFLTSTSASAAIIKLVATLTPFEEQPTALPFGGPPNATAIGPGPGELKTFAAGPVCVPPCPGVLPDLSGGPRPVSSGFAVFTLDTAVPKLTFTATVFDIDFTGLQTPGINDNLIAGHIHAGPPGTAIPGVSPAPVVWGFYGQPFNDTINGPGLAIPGDCVAFATGVGGTCSGTWDDPEGNGGTTLSAQLANILAGRSYINFHTVQFPGGEIRGQLLAPEPGSLVLILCALSGIYLVGRQRKGSARV